MPKFFFQRYVGGERMADDVLITQQPTLEAAIPAALRLCRNSPMSVLVHLPDHSELREENARLAEQLRLANVDCFNMEAENARLREALAPFVDAGHAKIVVTTGATEEDNMINICVKERDLRRAKEISK